MERQYLINNLIAGVYTNSDKYMARFTKNWQENYDNLPLIYDVQEGKINENMEKLRHRFIETGKRYWLFMDEDILFNDNHVIETALKTMQENDLALCSVYETEDKNIWKNLDFSELNFAHITWVAGYFILIDSEKVGLLPFDVNLPTSHGNLADIEYSMNVIVNDGLIGIAPTMIYHEPKGYSHKIIKPFAITKENEKEVNKSVKHFLKHLDKKYLYGMPSIEIVFLDNGEIDINETIGHQYLKFKYPDIHKEVVARPHYKVEKTKGKFTNQI